VFLFSSLFIVQFLFIYLLWGRGLNCPGGYAGLSQGWLWEYHMMLCDHLFVCRMSPKQVWSWCLVAAAALLFSQCNLY
jgi:hypothetical protein